ncbi:K02A2.6-like [Cordylochernes scorpioides]|uniref:K02A2.6-like n=1 Tax=Cordylochernes scorpioides TaxID=51811 RepID=A0ABY6LG61_9ARAC|nr:K02A2.6-like [Cordylochernes scorpioides]
MLSYTKRQTKTTLMLKEIPELPWEIVASDIFQFEGNEYIVIIDSYSGFINFEPINTINSKYTIGFLKRNFSIHGIPKVLETDNGRNYASREFNEFSNKWKFNHKTSSPHYPKSNGLTERAVQIAKNIIRKCKQSGDDIQIKYSKRRHGITSTKTTFKKTKTILPISKELLRPCIQKDVTLKLRRSRNKQKFYNDKGSRDEPTFKIGQGVYLRENRRNWKPATIVREDGPRSYTVQDNKGLYRRNQSHITTNQSQRDHESYLSKNPVEVLVQLWSKIKKLSLKVLTGRSCSRKLIIQLERRRPERSGSSQEAVARVPPSNTCSGVRASNMILWGPRDFLPAGMTDHAVSKHTSGGHEIGDDHRCAARQISGSEGEPE